MWIRLLDSNIFRQVSQTAQVQPKKNAIQPLFEC